MLKRKRLECKKILAAARGADCTINSLWCNYDPETTVAAHYRAAGECGTGVKPDDTSIAFACSTCHDWLDGRLHPDDEVIDRLDTIGVKDWYWFRGMRRTFRLLLETGVLT